jgi:protein O-GlcNAc transferase
MRRAKTADTRDLCYPNDCKAMGSLLAVSVAENEKFQRASAALQAGRFKDAERLFKTVLRTQPAHVAALNLLGIALIQLGQFAEAETYLRRALNEYSNSDATLYNYGIVLKALNRNAEAVERFTQALAINPAAVQAWHSRGIALSDLNRHDSAIADFDKAIALNPRFADALYYKARSLALLKRFDESSAAFERTLALRPDLAEAWCGFGNILSQLKQYDEALGAFEKALALKPELAEAWFGRACVFLELKQPGDANAAYEKALKAKPDLQNAAGLRLHAKLQMCDWTNLDTEVPQLLTAIRQNKPVSVPFAILSIPSSAADQLQCARRYMQDQPVFPPIWRGEAYAHDRIRVAYLSGDFHEHPTTFLAAGLLEQHDKSHFEITGISFGPNRSSPMRQRLEAACERFASVHDKSDQDIAELVRRLEIDIAVDLTGHTENRRLGILARRPAPIQVSYLGYLGTMGTDFTDYVIADEIALPSDQQQYYTEKIVHLPDCFLVNDNRLGIAAQVPSRTEAGLPAEGFVFCSFNNSYKLARPMFDLWMRALGAIDASVLWLVESNAEMAANLRREAQRCGVDPDRLIFAPRVALPDHLARHQLADLFLDTAPYNAGATGAAALWAGLPVLTVLGETLVGRMAASMLHAVGLPQLVANSLDDYEAMAIKLAADPASLAAIRRTLRDNIATAPLFDTDRFRRHLEQAYRTMVEIQRREEKPRGFAIAPL